MVTLCTLFNVNYLDKGLVLYDSLNSVSKDFTLYILAMDDKCYEVLQELHLKNIIPIKYSDFENEELKEARGNRTMGEFCWTCSSSLIEYIFEKYNPDDCTYIDADLYFYDDPKIIINEMYENGASALVTPHRFNKFEEKKQKVVGKYCVEFNTFRNDRRGRNLLSVWRDQCLCCCKCLGDGKHWGDQKYLDQWLEIYDYVVETSHIGAGMAPWNINQYKLVTDSPKLRVRRKGITQNLIFYHFEGITYLSEDIANIRAFNTWGVDSNLVNKLYKHYLNRIKEKKQLLEGYGVKVLISSHPAVIPQKITISQRIKAVISNILNFKHLFYISIPSHFYKNSNYIRI